MCTAVLPDLVGGEKTLYVVSLFCADEAEGFYSREAEVWPNGQESSRSFSQQREPVKARIMDWMTFLNKHSVYRTQFLTRSSCTMIL